MKNKYASCGLKYDLIINKYPNINEYEEIVNAYLADDFFNELEFMLENEDYEIAKDATKGLFILAGDLLLYPLYEALIEIYEDLEYEMYDNIIFHYKEMKEKHKTIRSIFNA